MTRIDGKYEVLRETQVGEQLVQEAIDTAGQAVTLLRFDIPDSSTRALFHKYRATLKAIGSQFLVDVVARPGAYYSVWLPITGISFEEFLASTPKNPETIEAIQKLAKQLAENGYALSDTQIVIVDSIPQLSGLDMLSEEHTPEAIAILNKPILEALAVGQSKRIRKLAAGAKPPLTIWGVWPGMVFVVLVVYLGQQTVMAWLNPAVLSVPAVVNKDANSAAAQLAKAGFRVQVINGEASGQALGLVIQQDPIADSVLHAGRLVSITINNPPPLIVPKLSELNIAGVKQALKEADLRLGKIAYTYTTDPNFPKGAVIAQSPAMGTEMTRGSTVDVMISQGARPRQTFLPDLTGLNFEEAKTLIKQADLVLTAVYPAASEQPENTVLSQSIDPYVKVKIGQPVTIEIARTPMAPPPPRRNLNTAPLGQIVIPPKPEPEIQPELTTPETTTPDTQPAPETTTPETQPVPETTTPDTQPVPETTTPDTQPVPETTTPDTQPVPETTTPQETTPEPSTNVNGQTRTLSFEYAFPENLPQGKTELRVSDENGEQPALLTQDNAAGLRVKVEAQVTGKATFTVVVDGQIYDNFTR